MKVKLYYDENTGFLCGRAPKCISITPTTPYILVDEKEVDKTYACQTGTFWGVKDGKLQLLDDKNSEEYISLQKANHIAELHAYLSDTDYVISKLQESKLTDTDKEYQKMLDSYKDVLKKRKETRNELNLLEQK